MTANLTRFLEGTIDIPEAEKSSQTNELEGTGPTWHTSAKGNPYVRLEDGLTITVFPEKKSGFKFCVAASKNDRMFAPFAFDTVERAKEAGLIAAEHYRRALQEKRR